MPRTDTDETWEKLPDGSMQLVSATLREVSDEEIEKEDSPRLLEELDKKASWSAMNVEQAIRLLIRKVKDR